MMIPAFSGADANSGIPRNQFSSKCLLQFILYLFFAWTLGVAGLTGDAQAQELIRSSDVPGIVLINRLGNFFVFASDIPFEISKAETTVIWLEVENLKGEKAAHQVVRLNSNPKDLPQGTYFSAVRVDLTTASGSDYLLLPVVLCIGRAFEIDPIKTLPLLQDIPAEYIRLQVDDPNIEVRFVLTPAGHYIFEVVDLNREKIRLQQILDGLSTESLDEDAGVDGSAADILSAMYEVVFPWMCLEYPCGSTTADDIADVEPNLDAVNHISFERYTISSGSLQTYNVGNPGPWATQVGLGTWPMLTGGYNPSSSAIQAMWNNRNSIADQLISQAVANGYRGYCVDVEGYADEVTKNTFISLVDYFANRLHADGYKIMVAHATWSTIAPIADLANTSVDFVATMDPYTSLWDQYIPVNYSAIDPSRLIWGFTWDRVEASTQTLMWQWMASNGYNVDVAGSAAWRTPLMPPHPGNELNYYDGFRQYYPISNDGDNCMADVPANRWLGEYFDNPDLSGIPLMVRDDGDGFLDFDWGSGSPSSQCGISADLFSVRWTREVDFIGGLQRFTITSDDGFRLYVDDVLVIEKWFNQRTTYTVDVGLTHGIHTLELEYYENLEAATIRLSWKPRLSPASTMLMTILMETD